MELRLSNLAKTYPASGIRKMFDLAAGYDDVIALTLGEPNFETPAYIKEAAKKALDENYTHYAPNAGSLRELGAAARPPSEVLNLTLSHVQGGVSF